jgi:hypothetical protein
LTSGLTLSNASAIASLTSAAAGIYGALAGGPDAPNIPPAPAPASYYTYDADGNLTGSQVWDASKNAYVYREGPLTEEEKAEKAKMASIRSTMLDNLNKTPEDRLKAYEEYAKSFSDSMHADVDERFAKLRTSQEETLAARGMLGSRAYADTLAELNSDKMKLDEEIATKAVLAKEDLANTDRDYWLRAMTALDASENADAALAIQKQHAGMQGAAAGTSALNAKAAIDSSKVLRDWEIRNATNTQKSQSLLNTSTGLAFLYGYNNKKP